MKCQYCGSKAVLRKNSAFLYNGKDFGPIWICSRFPRCRASVSAHRRTLEPMGQLANKDLRDARRLAHRQFDPLWNGGKMSRNKAYEWLARVMKLSKPKCHIGSFNIKQCEEVAKHVIDKLRSLK